MFLIKTDCMPHDQLRLLEAWEEWEIPIEQKWEWVVQLFGEDYVSDLTNFLTYETLDSKENESHLPPLRH